MAELQPKPIEPPIRDLLSGKREPRSGMEGKFKVAMEDHPEIYQMFCRFTGQMIDAGKTEGAARVVLERIRWETIMAPTDEGIEGVVKPLKINNNHHPYLSRLWMEDHPSHPEFFVTRKTRGKNGPDYDADGQVLMFGG